MWTFSYWRENHLFQQRQRAGVQKQLSEQLALLSSLCLGGLRAHGQGRFVGKQAVAIGGGIEKLDALGQISFKINFAGQSNVALSASLDRLRSAEASTQCK
jgi:hypothetical protein